eukprot:CAMPEP_0168539334 /NCGR_PEP_ID=MMETSP0405-20121227/21764_1 /TAXON_ID=498012 /ORGANISM="Trichosphaerium sp, Strain Am-I-7 wt" /LENGTH=89 /DNA_ID=CAMNT_0008568873 /DNA_START=14 /DNA_END=280 /DNA_ORIENTATION=-
MDTTGKSDPYVEVQVGYEYKWSKVWKTKVKNNTLSPVWNEEFTIPVGDVYQARIRLKLKDKDIMSADDQMGGIEIPLKGLEKGAVHDKW